MLTAITLSQPLAMLRFSPIRDCSSAAIPNRMQSGIKGKHSKNMQISFATDRVNYTWTCRDADNTWASEGRGSIKGKREGGITLMPRGFPQYLPGLCGDISGYFPWGNQGCELLNRCGLSGNQQRMPLFTYYYLIEFNEILSRTS